MGRLRFIVGLLLLAAFLMVFSQSLNGVLLLIKENLPFQVWATNPEDRAPGAQQAAQTAASAEAFSKNWNDQLAQWKEQITSFSQKLSLPVPPPAPPAPKPAKPQPPKAPAPQKPEQEPLLHIMMEDERPPLENKLLGPEISAMLDDFLSRRREYNTQRAQITAQLFGPEAAQEAVRTLFADETASFANAATCQSPEAFAANQQKIDEQTEKNMLAIYKRHKQQIGKQEEATSPAWKAFFKRVENYERVSANGDEAPAQPE